MNLHRALSDIADIRAQLDRTESYRGFRSTAVGASVLIVILGAIAQTVWASEPLRQVDRFLIVWFAVAIASAALATTEMLIRAKVSDNRLVGRVHWSLARQIAPCLLVGFALTVLIGAHAIDQPPTASLLWSLPGVWSIVYAAGLFACRTHLPAPVLGVAIYFMAAGLLLLIHNWLTRDLAGWQMIASFGGGHVFLASVLFWNLEKRDGQAE